MCRPKVPKSPTVTVVPDPPKPQEGGETPIGTAETLGETFRRRTSLLGRFDLQSMLPPNFRIPQ